MEDDEDDDEAIIRDHGNNKGDKGYVQSNQFLRNSH